MVRLLNAIRMKTFNNNILEKKLIYKSQDSDSAMKTWTLKKTKCKIYLYEDESCSDIEKIICSTLYFHDSKLSINELATILGFNVVDNFDTTPIRYKDEAEICIFNCIIKSLEEEELVVKDEKIISLTSLGIFTVHTSKKRKFYEAECRFLENFNLAQEDNTPFPFRDSLYIITAISAKRRISYYKVLSSYDIEPIVKEEEKHLVCSLLAQMQVGIHIFSASLISYDFTIESENINIGIYNDNSLDYVVVYSNDGNVSEYASEIINDDRNEKIRNIKIEWGYYLRLLNDPNALLDFDSLEQFEDIIEWNKIVKDDRFCWNDKRLFEMLSRNIDANIWHDVSSICPPECIKIYLKDSIDGWDWSILSARMDGKYIIQNASVFPWNFDIVIHNTNVTTDDIENLLINPKLTSVQWPWTDIMPSLSDDFILKHIDDVSFELSLITESTPSLVKDLILKYPDKSWNWKYISKSYALDYILTHIELLSKRLDLASVTSRALSSDVFSYSYCKSQTFKENLKNFVDSAIAPLNFNSSKLIWSYENIDFLEEIGALTWCVPIIGGFENNQYIKWDKNFFNRYSYKISTAEGYTCVTTRISDFTIVDDNNDFPWNWEIISTKADWIKDIGFVKRHLTQLNLKKSFELLSSETFCALFKSTEIQTFLSLYPEYKAKATDLATIKLVRENIDFDWDWNFLTAKTIQTIKIERLGDERWVNKWDWEYLSKNLSIDSISDYLEEYQDYWNWSILTNRLGRNIVFENLAEYADLWDWPVLVKSVFTKEDLSIDSFLPTIATIISLKDENLKSLLWNAITRRFNLEELYGLVHYTRTLSEYQILFSWDLSYIYNHEDFNLSEYIEQYSEDVDWELLSKSKSAERFFFYDKTILSFQKWLEMVKSLLYNPKYDWNFYALSQNEAINRHHAILKIHTDEWDWEYLSKYSRCFSSYASKGQANLSKNIKQFKNVLDFDILSNRTDIIFNDALLKDFLDQDWNWRTISASEKLSVSNQFIIDNQEKDWDWGILSQGQQLIIDKSLLESTKQKAWDWKSLSSNKKLKVSLKELLSLDITNWDWNVLSGRHDIAFDNETFLSTLDKAYISWDWLLLSSRTDLQYNDDLIMKLWQKPMDWKSVSRMSTFTPTVNVLSKISDFELDWDAISKNKFLSKDVLWPYRNKLNWQYISQSETFQILGFEFFCKYREYLDWTIISNSTAFTLSIKNLREFKDEIDWEIIGQRKDLKYTNILLDEFAEYINWHEASIANTIEFSVDFIKKHINRWDWFALFENPLIVENIDKYKLAFKDKINGIRFINRFNDSDPKVYHFAHLFNAVNIIKSRKILSRIGGKGLFENSAGSNVYRRETAHHYARFYYRPQTPTQYYNEALGEDSHASKTRWVFGGYDNRGKKIWDSYIECPTAKYLGAQRLGSPKCPMPVFFEFDLREILNLCIEKCYYSTGNMQSDNSQIISIIDNPNRLNTQYLYSTIEDGLDIYKSYSQQEFLVKNGLDFSCLKNFRIICYDEEQAAILKAQLGDDPICKYITTDSETSSCINIYHRTNRTISINETENSLYVSTDYQDPSSIVIECDDINSLNIIDKSHITNIAKGKIQAYPYISLKKPTVPFTIRFMDLQKYDSNSWIIYSNESKIEEPVKKYSIFTNSLIEQFKIETSKLQINISKSLFKEHMLHSYHGIAHTIRVMWNAFIISSLDKCVKQDMITSILYAALIHDLGKRSDTEGEIHGTNSAKLYTSKIESLCDEGEAATILEAVKFHSIDDSKTPFAVHQNKIWEVLKDADALDRSRLPGRGCNPAFLRNKIFSSKEGQEIISMAKELPYISNGCSWENPINDIINVLHSMI